MIRRSLIAAALVAASFAAPVSAEGLEDMTDGEREAFRAEVRAYLLDHPEVILEAIDVLEARRTAATAENDRRAISENATALYEDGHSFVGGNPEGDVTVVEFMDYRCAYCKRSHPIVRQMLEDDPQIRFIQKQFPILGPDSVDAARVAMAALDADRSRYLALSDALMEYPGNMTEEVALRIAGSLGYDMAALREAAGAPEIGERLNANYALANALGLQGTPSFVIGTQVVRGFLPLEDMVATVESARTEMN